MLIERYLTTEIVKPFLAGLLILVTLFIAFSAAVRLADAASGEIAAAAVTQLIILSTLASMEVLVPTTLYLAILFAIGRWYKDSEMAALAAAGVGEMQLLWSVFKIGVIAAVIVALLSIYVRPWAYGTSYALAQATISRFDLGTIPPGSFVDLGNGW